ncbi:MAG: Gfo/Idh/MocA family oxidoreductase [Lacibacter sp.]|jgi:hypothetical protein
MSSSFTRRDILKTIGAFTGAAALPISSLAESGVNEPDILPEFELVPHTGKTITAITCGAGNRGNVYGDMAIQYPDRINIIGVAEPIAIRNERYAQKHKIKDENRFKTWEDVFKKPKFADAIIITTPDNLHYGPCMKALEMGYDVLLEKPISPSEKECRNILAMVKKTGRIVAVCHVLRFAPYFSKLKELINNGSIGNLISVHHFEPIEHIHMSHSFVRGNWHNSKQAAPIILTKSCHDLDIIRWVVNKPSKSIHALGNLSWFTLKNAPEGSTERCTDGCKAEAACPYSALKIYTRNNEWTYVFDLPEDKSKQAAYIMEQLKSTNYGRCVYRMDNDQCDHYTTNILFEDDVTVSFTMEAFTSYDGRRTRVMGSMGDIVGDMRSLTHTDFRTGKVNTYNFGNNGHGDGDWPLAINWVNAVANQDPSILSSSIDASIESHLMAFAAEKSRSKRNVEIIRL